MAGYTALPGYKDPEIGKKIKKAASAVKRVAVDPIMSVIPGTPQNIQSGINMQKTVGDLFNVPSIINDPEQVGENIRGQLASPQNKFTGASPATIPIAETVGAKSANPPMPGYNPNPSAAAVVPSPKAGTSASQQGGITIPSGNMPVPVNANAVQGISVPSLMNKAFAGRIDEAKNFLNNDTAPTGNSIFKGIDTSNTAARTGAVKKAVDAGHIFTNEDLQSGYGMGIPTAGAASSPENLAIIEKNRADAAAATGINTGGSGGNNFGGGLFGSLLSVAASIGAKRDAARLDSQRFYRGLDMEKLYSDMENKRSDQAYKSKMLDLTGKNNESEGKYREAQTKQITEGSKGLWGGIPHELYGQALSASMDDMGVVDPEKFKANLEMIKSFGGGEAKTETPAGYTAIGKDKKTGKTIYKDPQGNTVMEG